MDSLDFSPQNIYRLPWNLSDNSISWLEPTSACNLYCDGCYRENRKNSHKSLSEIKHELDVFEKNRKTDGVSITGGEPLTHPNILDIVKLVNQKGWKAIINTNGALLTEELLKKLKGCRHIWLSLSILIADRIVLTGKGKTRLN
jgi:MoaA/NifB/PqqE/SkfB family radical SAM enzyme